MIITGEEGKNGTKCLVLASSPPSKTLLRQKEGRQEGWEKKQAYFWGEKIMNFITIVLYFFHRSEN